MRPNQLSGRELGAKTKLRSEDLIDGADVIEKLDLYKTLRGHGGCVNTLKWNYCGSLLASGSDDETVRLWNMEGDSQCTYETSHAGNIFGLSFMNEDSHIMSCAADNTIILTNLETKEELSKWTTNGRVKGLASSSFFPNICWSISEDSCVRMHDIRHPESDVKFNIGQSGKSIDVSELQMHWIAVGSESTNVSIYDTRNTRRPVLKLRPLDMRESSPYYVTHVSFARKSNSLLVNYGRGSTYLFDLDDSSRESIFCQQLNLLCQSDSTTHVRCSMEPLISTSVQNVIELIGSLVAGFHYVEALTTVTDTLKKEDLSDCERAYLLLKRSTIFLARKREGDSYAAAKDTLLASMLIKYDPQPMLRLITVLQTMEQADLCIDIIDLFKKKFPDSVDELGDVEESLRTLFPHNRRDHNIRRISTRVRDYSRRYCGHTNENTDIKEASFFGPKEQYIMAGSDTGHIFVYNRDDSSIITLLKGDNSIVNSIEPHPYLPLVASSGLDNYFSLFAPYNSSEMPHPPLFSYRITHSDAEPALARHNTRNLVHELVLLNRLGAAQNGHEQCRVS